LRVTSYDSIAAFIAGTDGRPQRIGDVVAHALARAHADDPVQRIYTRLLDAAASCRVEFVERRAWAPLRGVPVAIKDNVDVADEPTTCGRRLDPAPALASAAIVARLEALGAILVGKTNLDEAALGASGRNPRFGRCHNPRFADRLSGGSSSGSAAAVAAGHVLLGIGTDTLGSVRIPAAYCGIVGFKPTHGRLSMAGVAPLYPRYDSLGLLAGSLADAAQVAGLLLDEAPAPGPVQAGDLRLGVLDEAALAGVEGAVADAYRDCLRLLEDSGAERRFTVPQIPWSATARAALWEVAHDFAERSARELPGYPGLNDIDGALGALLARAAGRSATRLADGRALLEDSHARMRLALIEADAVLTPTCPQQAPRVAEDPANDVAAFVAPANLAGLPAVAWTQRFGADRSVSLQLIGRAGEDIRLLALAARIERLLESA
jgi:aspartyl-tRNA(Asn)/glutamyl-tRNA(Gln) amidotransferase subunit A